MRSLLLALILALPLGVQASNAHAAGVCPLEASMCTSMYEAKYKEAFDTLRKPASQQKGAEVMTVQVMYGTFEQARKKAKCSASEKVALDGYKPMFVLGEGKAKRAMMVRGKAECAFVPVR